MATAIETICRTKADNDCLCSFGSIQNYPVIGYIEDNEFRGGQLTDIDFSVSAKLSAIGKTMHSIVS